MDITEYTKQQGTFLKAQDIIDNPEAVFVIIDEGTIETSKLYGNERLHLTGKFNDAERIFDCSKTNARFIEERLGNDTREWMGKTLIFEVYKTKTSDGKLVDAINVKEVK